MSDKLTFTPTTCKNCNCAFDVANPWVNLVPGNDASICPHCGQMMEVD